MRLLPLFTFSLAIFCSVFFMQVNASLRFYFFKSYYHFRPSNAYLVTKFRLAMS